MKHSLAVFYFLILSFRGISQHNLLFDRFTVDSTYQIIGLCPYEDDTKQYTDLTFLISDINALTKAKATVSYGQIVPKPAPYEENSLEIYVLKDKEIVETYSVSPKYNQVSFYLNDSTPVIYEFKVHDILRYASIQPLSYSEKDITFKSRKEFEKFVTTNRKSKQFLCYEDISEDKEGKFDIVIQGNDKFKASDGWAIVKAELQTITANKEDYVISYTPNLQNLSVLTYTVNTGKEVYDKFKLTEYAKGKWTPNIPEVLAYWLK